MLLVANSGDTILCEKPGKMTETLSNGYSSKSTPQELSNEYQHDRVWMIFKNLCVLVLWTKVASALEGFKEKCSSYNHFFNYLIKSFFISK